MLSGLNSGLAWPCVGPAVGLAYRWAMTLMHVGIVDMTTTDTTLTTLTVCRVNLPPRLRDTAEATFVDRFGGATRVDAIGAWRAPHGAMIREPMDAWEVAMSDADARGWVPLVVSLAETIEEQMVYVVVDGRAALVPTKWYGDENAAGVTTLRD